MSSTRSSQAPNEGAPSGSIRRRAKRACEPCRRRKRKCDGANPCRSCQEYEYTCVYNDEQAPLQSGTIPVPSSGHVVASTTETTGLAAANEHEKFYEPNKRRFYDAASAISFPRALALSLKVGVPPRIHSFAYNVGVTPEHFLQPSEGQLSRLISFGEARAFSTTYSETVNKLFAVVDFDVFEHQLAGLWQPESSVSLEFEALACFIILLGSLFSWPARSDNHQALADLGQQLLDEGSFRDAPSLLHYENLQAWILRTIYVRCTTRPNITWISSSITVHLAESLGLHREMDSLEKLGLNVVALSEGQVDQRRRLFWTAWALNRMISFEIGRSPTFVTSTNILMPQALGGTSTHAIISAYKAVYHDEGHITTEEPGKCLLTIAKVKESDEYQDSFIAMVNADIACGLYRVIHKSNPHISQSVGEHLAILVKRGLSAVRQLTEQSQPWWLLTSMPFQFICVAVAVGKPYILSLIPEAMEVLDNVNQHFGTLMTEEASETARLLLQTAVQSRELEVAAINRALQIHDRAIQPALPSMEEEDWGLFFNNQLNG